VWLAWAKTLVFSNKILPHGTYACPKSTDPLQTANAIVAAVAGLMINKKNYNFKFSLGRWLPIDQLSIHYKSLFEM